MAYERSPVRTAKVKLTKVSSQSKPQSVAAYRAETAKVLEKYDFETKRHNDAYNGRRAEFLYMNIFYHRTPLFPNNPRDDVDLKSIGSSGSCSGCAKSIMHQLRDWMKETKSNRKTKS